MLIHGRLILTHNGIMLDEVRSLLQKALRRKELALIASSCKELLGYEKDQLPWKSLVTFLFEDHCLSDSHVLETFWGLVEHGMITPSDAKEDKLRCVELVSGCYTCRIAACLPVIAMHDEYDPTDWDPNLEVDEQFIGLVQKSVGQLRVDLLLAHMKNAWREFHTTNLITYMKLATVAQDCEQHTLTKKGLGYLIGELLKKTKPGVGLLVMSMLYKNTTETNLKRYIYFSYKLATIPDVPVRLILSAVVTQLLYRHHVTPLDNLNLGWMKLGTTPVLSQMPGWAVDKHTFRGKFGKGTMHLLRKRAEGMTEEHLEEFHGVRPKKGLHMFFTEGVVCANDVVENPFYEKTEEMYNRHSPRQQKTARMTVTYFEALKQKYPSLLYRLQKKMDAEAGRLVDSDDSDAHIAVRGRKQVKRKCSTTDQMHDETKPSTSGKRMKANQSKQTQKQEKVHGTSTVGKRNWFQAREEQKEKSKLTHIEQELTGTKESKGVTGKLHKALPTKSQNREKQKLALKGPLLQLPTGSGKVYTCLDMESLKVWKGPFRATKLNLVVFYHKVMKDILHDRHTLTLEIQDPYILFPFLKDPHYPLEVIKKDFYDAIQKCHVTQGEFVTRESLGVLKVTQLPLHQVKDLPMSFWAHFLYRFALNVGDSGLYNAIADKAVTFLYGIDMEEYRAHVRGSGVVDLMFPKLPAKPIVKAIQEAIAGGKDELLALLGKEVDLGQLDDLAKMYEVKFDSSVFARRIEMAKDAVVKM